MTEYCTAHQLLRVTIGEQFFMAKYTSEEKLQVALSYLEGNESSH